MKNRAEIGKSAKHEAQASGVGGDVAGEFDLARFESNTPIARSDVKSKTIKRERTE